jgi:hypothetical protein
MQAQQQISRVDDECVSLLPVWDAFDALKKQIELCSQREEQRQLAAALAAAAAQPQRRRRMSSKPSKRTVKRNSN